MLIILALALISSAAEKHHVKERWKSFCERHLIADDPYDKQDQQDKTDSDPD